MRLSRNITIHVWKATIFVAELGAGASGDSDQYESPLVKSSAYVQARHQEKPSTIQFGIRKTREWLPETNSFGSEKKRHSEVYVFCLLAEQQKERINPLDLSQWEFYVLPTLLIDRVFGDKETISLNQVIQHATKLAVDEIKTAVRQGVS